jgi:hypothetical protein
MNYARSDNCEVIQLGNSVTITGPYSDDRTRLHSVTIKLADVEKYNEGMLIQNAFPYLSPDDREFLQTGTSPEGWKRMYGDEE